MPTEPKPIQFTEEERDRIATICHDVLRDARKHFAPEEELRFWKLVLEKLAYAKRHWS